MPASDSTDERVFTDEALGFELFWQKNKAAILLALVAAGVTILAGVGWLIHRHSTRLASEAALMAATSAEEFRAVAERYKGLPAGRTARMLMAAQLAAAGDRSAAIAQYRSFAEQYPEDPLAGPARIAQATLVLADGQEQLGLDLLNAASSSPNPFTAQLGLFFKARELVGSGDYAAARSSLQLLTTSYGTSPAAELSRGLFQQIAAIEPQAAPAASDSASPALQIAPAASPSP